MLGALSGEKALKTMEESRPDLILADVMMPGNHEFELVQALRRLTPRTSVIVITGYPSLRSAIRAIELGTVAFLVKPFDFEEVLAHVSAAMEKADLEQTVAVTRQYLQHAQQALLKIENTLRTRPHK